jgi:hypothetical protein
VNGDVTAFCKRLSTACQIRLPKLNCGLSSEPDTGMFTSICPFEFLSSEMARRTGSFVAVSFST